MEAFPAFFPLAGRKVVIAGEGDGAEAKARLLAGSPAEIVRIDGAAALTAAAYAGAALAFVASEDTGFCAAAAAAAQAAAVPTNVVDHPELSDFHTPAIVDRGQVVAALGTAGAAPIVAALIRAELDARLPAGLGRLAALFGQLREEIRASLPDLAERRVFLRTMMSGPVAEAADADDLATAERLMRAALARGVSMHGRIWLIEAPEARDLLSLRAARALAEADLLVLGDRVPADIATLARRDAPRRTLKEAKPAFLASEAAAGRQTAVVAGMDALTGLALALEASAAHHFIYAAPGA